ncbi:hypothetical protein [Paenibacillus polymyxa]|uniref:hypothetical protein n=1 Tax=Paenibacillus polymyxa TaxID=1406 RepID=UPI001F5715A9|nr:hypothetical protein [Paenibacillus polymyxa]
MRIYIAGINHNDPLSRIELIEWMNGIARHEQTSPDFVAPEWKEEYFNLVKEQRAEFDKRVRSEWSSLTEKQIEAITLSLGYEGDAHKEVFGELPVLWLDQERNAGNPSVKDFYKYRFKNLRDWAQEIDKNENFLTLLSKMIRNIQSVSVKSNPSIDPGRDAAFHKVINNECSSYRLGWAIIVVGALHALPTPGSMRSLLETDGYQCIVKDLSR